MTTGVAQARPHAVNVFVDFSVQSAMYSSVGLGIAFRSSSMALITYENTWRETVKRFAVTAAFVAGVFALTGCDNPTNTPSDSGGDQEVIVPPPVELDLDFDGTKTKTVTVPPPVVPKPMPPKPQTKTQTPVKPAPAKKP